MKNKTVTIKSRKTGAAFRVKNVDELRGLTADSAFYFVKKGVFKRQEKELRRLSKKPNEIFSLRKDLSIINEILKVSDKEYIESKEGISLMQRKKNISEKIKKIEAARVLLNYKREV